MQPHSPEIATEVIKALPAVSVSTLIFFGIPLSEWVFIGSIILILLQIVAVIRDKYYVPWRDRNERKSRE